MLWRSEVNTRPCEAAYLCRSCSDISNFLRMSVSWLRVASSAASVICDLDRMFSRTNSETRVLANSELKFGFGASTWIWTTRVCPIGRTFTLSATSSSNASDNLVLESAWTNLPIPVGSAIHSRFTPICLIDRFVFSRRL